MSAPANSLADLVSVIIPTYNRAETVLYAIESALKQDYPNKQIIVIDDGSTDATEQLLKNHAGILYVRQSNQRQAAARNKGLSVATGNFIATLDSDDRWDPQYLSYAIDSLRQHDAGIFFANWREASLTGSIDCENYFKRSHLLAPYLEKVDAHQNVYLTADESRRLFLESLPAPSSGMVLRRNLVRHGWRELRVGEDWLLALEAILEQKPASVFTTKILWTKYKDQKNLCDGAYDTAPFRRELAVNSEIIDRHISHLLNQDEQKRFRRMVAQNYFDYAYYLSSHNPVEALANYLHSATLHPNPKCASALAKTLLKSAWGLIKGVPNRPSNS